MNRRLALIALPFAALLIAAAPPIGDTVKVVLTTTQGQIELELDHKHAPLTVENFMRYVDQRRMDGAVFYRAMHLAWGEQPNGLLQGGLQGNYQKVLKPVAHEPTTVTGLSHKAGTISMARNAPGTATADFSILLSDLPGLDADPKGTTPDAQAGFAVFGKVTAGMDVVRKIWDTPRSQTKGEGVMKGQMLEVPVKIVTARRGTVPAQ